MIDTNAESGDCMIHIEVRKKIVEARQRGILIKDISATFGYSESAISRLLRKERETGDITPETHLRGRKPALGEGELESMRQLILCRSDITLEEIKETMSLSISIPAISKIVNKKLRFTYKKRHYTPAKETERMFWKTR